LTARSLVKPGVRRIGDVLFHHGRVDGHALGAVLINHPGFLSGPDSLGQQPFDTLLANPPPPAGQRRRVNRWPVLEESLPGEVLVIRVFDPAGDDRLI
jgi:hypothetical protein